MRVADELRGIAASFSRASKRSSSERFSSLAIAFRAARLAALAFTRRLTFSLRLTALFLAILVLVFPALRVERELEFAQQLARFVVGAGGGADDDVHAPDLIDLVIVDLGEHDVLAKPER